MDIIPQILTENEFREFRIGTYQALANVLDDSLAKYIKEYCENPEADQDIVETINERLGESIEALTFHFTLQNMGIIDLVKTLSPENLFSGNFDLDDIYDKLKFLEENEHKLRSVIPSRSKAAYEAFLGEMDALVSIMKDQGKRPTYPDMLDRISDNKFIFYVPNDKGHYTRSNVIYSKRQQWLMCLRGIEYKRYCEQNNIIHRRAF